MVFLCPLDCPGHEVLMATMLNAAAAMDAAILVIAANLECPQPQTAEHLAAAELIGLKHVIPVQNKLDLVDRKKGAEHMKQIRKFVEGTAANNSPIIPVSAQVIQIRTLKVASADSSHDCSMEAMWMFCASIL